MVRLRAHALHKDKLSVLSQVPRASIIDKMLQDQTYLVQVHTVSSKSETHTKIYALLLENL